MAQKLRCPECRSANLEGPDHYDGTLDCLDCGFFFTAEEAKRYRLRLPQGEPEEPARGAVAQDAAFPS